jgi:acetyltransferase-like isoleucine patch superfamily enzyme
MNPTFSKTIISWLITKLEGSDKFRIMITGIIEEFYIKNSLHKYRVWGDSSRLSIGNNVHLNNAIINTTSGKVVVGDNAFLGHNVSLLTGTHDYRQTGLARQSSVPESGRDIVIREGVWIASNATIIGPCEIGENTVIGAASVITGTIPPNSVYAGTPAKLIRQI